MSNRRRNVGKQAEDKVEAALEYLKKDEMSGVLDFRRTTPFHKLKALDEEGIDFLIYLKPITIRRGDETFTLGKFLALPLQVKNSGGRDGEYIKSHIARYPHILAIAVGKSSKVHLANRIKKQIRKILRGKKTPRS